MTHGTFNADRSTVIQHDVFYDGEPQTGAAGFARAGLVNAVEPLKDARQMLGSNAWATGKTAESREYYSSAMLMYQDLEDWQAVAQRKAGPLFRKVSTSGRVGGTALHPDAVRRILAHRLGMAGLTPEGFDRLSAHALRVGFITEAYAKGVRDEDIMAHTRHRDLRTMRGYVRRAGLVTESPAGMLDL